MRKVFSAMIVTSFMLSGIIVPETEAIEIYTFKKKRVDQELKGNRGYISGTAPAPQPRKDKRTLIGIDIELPSIGGDRLEADYRDPKNEGTKSGGRPVTVVSDENWIK